MKKHSPKIATFKYKTLQKQNTKFKKVILMEFLRNKKGIVSHPAVMFTIAFILGVIVTVLWANQIIAVPFPFCK